MATKTKQQKPPKTQGYFWDLWCCKLNVYSLKVSLKVANWKLS